MDRGPTPEQRAQMSTAAVAAGLGCSIAATIVVMIGGGILLDRVLDTSPIFTLVGVGIGLAGAIYQLFELTRVGRPPEQAPPITKGLIRLRQGRNRHLPRDQ